MKAGRDWDGPEIPRGCRKTAIRILAVIGILAVFTIGADTALAVQAIRHHQAHHALFRAVSLS